jgi:hypothetical protein
MKKLLTIVMMLLTIISLTGCAENKETPGLGAIDRAPELVTTLENAGYELTMHDDDAINYFQENTVDDLVADTTVTALYIGYLDGNNWVQVIGFETSQDAYNLKAAYEAEEDEGQYVYVMGNALVLTYTEETYNLFE